METMKTVFRLVSYTKDFQIDDPIFIDDNNGGKYGTIKEITSIKWVDCCEAVEIRGIANLITTEDYKKKLEEYYNETN